MSETERLPAARLRALSEKSNERGFMQAGGHLAALALCTTGLALTWGSWWSVPLFMLQGILLCFLYAGVHELSHYTVFKTRPFNEWVGALFAFLILVPRDFDRYEHYEHHRFTQDPLKDTDLAGRPPYRIMSYLLYLCGISYWARRIATLVGTAVNRHRPGYLKPEQLLRVQREARRYLAGYAAIVGISVYLESAAGLYFWILPMVAMKWTQQLQNLAEHTGMPQVRETFANTRTIRTHPLLRRLAWNMPYHTAHHLYPGVPFHALPELHAEVVKLRGKEPETVSYWGFQWRMFRKLLREGHAAYSGRPLGSY